MLNQPSPSNKNVTILHQLLICGPDEVFFTQQSGELFDELCGYEPYQIFLLECLYSSDQSTNGAIGHVVSRL